MSNSANIPAMGNKIVVDIPALNALLQQMIRAELANVADLPVRAKQMVEGANGWEFQQFNGSGWATLTDWNINAQQVDGYSASAGTTANTIPVRDASGKIPGDISGNAATATKANELSETNPVAMGGTGATTAEQARENLVVPPKKHSSGSDEYGAGSSTQYGHLKSHDEPDSTLTAATGHAFSPAGAASLKTELEEQIEEVETGASSKLSTLDTSLRSLIAQEVAKCLKLTGGTMTGPILLKNADIYGVDNKARVHLGGGTHWDQGALLVLNGKERDGGGGHTGSFQLAARDNTNNAVFEGRANGELFWAGKNIVRSVNGTNADAGGNVSLSIPKPPVTSVNGMTGAVSVSWVNNAGYADNAGWSSNANVGHTSPNIACAKGPNTFYYCTKVSSGKDVYAQLPSGGTWRYITSYGEVGQVSGGSKIQVVSYYDGSYTYSYMLAIRVA